MLIEALDEVDVSGAMFFVTTDKIKALDNNGGLRLQQYVEAGHILASHSHTHPDLNNSSVKSYLAEIDQSFELLKPFDNVENYFRLPYLREGDDEAKRNAISKGLTERDIKTGMSL